jgi:hypothetical protein
VKNLFKKLSLVFAAGALGGLVNSTVLWLSGRAGITAELGVKLAPTFTPAWLYPRLVWGGIWGILFLLPLAQNRPFQQGLLISLGPTIVQLFVIFPYQLNKGMMGFELGPLTPLFVLFINAVWGVATALWLRASGKN